MRKFLAVAAIVAFATPAFRRREGHRRHGRRRRLVQDAGRRLQGRRLVDTLKGEGPFTVLAPTVAAFAKLPAGTVESCSCPRNKDKLIAILTYHVIPAKAMAADVVKLDGKSVKTVQGSTVKVDVEGKTVMINDAKVIKTDIACTNGVIHVIDTVILPPAK